MKKVEVFRCVVDLYLDSFTHRNIKEEYINQWKETEEYEFLRKYTITPIEQVSLVKHDSLERIIICYATLNEKTETFWRLKYK